MDKIAKALKKLSNSERAAVKIILLKLKNKQFNNLDIKKLKGRDDIFRVRKGRIRIIYRAEKSREIFILSMERRKDTTYNLH